MNRTLGNRHRTTIIIAGLSIIIVLLRLPFFSKYLFEWDSVQYALSLKNFNILWHQPHPPGYILFVLAIRVFRLFIYDDNLAIISCISLFSILSVSFHYLLSNKLLNDSTLSIVSSMLLITSPVFWFNGEIASIYIIEAFASLLVIYLYWESITKCDSKYFLVASFSSGLFLGFRQSLLVVYLPIAVFAFLKIGIKLQTLLIAGLIFTFAISIWLIPTAISCGDLRSYLDSTSGLAGPLFERVEIIFGSLQQYLSINLSNFIIWLLLGITPFSVIFVSLAIIQQVRIYKLQNLLRDKFQLFALWIIPSMLVYSLYIEKPGYLLSIVPPLIIILVKGIHIFASSLGEDQSYKKTLFITTVIICLVSCLWFLMPISSNPENPKVINPPNYVNSPPLSDYSWDISNRLIKKRDTEIGEVISFFSENRQFSPRNSIIVYAGGVPTWRHLSYYLPEYETLWVVDESISGNPYFGSEIYISKDRMVTSASGLPFWQPGIRENEVTYCLDIGISNIVWFLDNDTSAYQDLTRANYQHIYLQSGLFMIIAPIRNEEINVSTFTFSHCE